MCSWSGRGHAKLFKTGGPCIPHVFVYSTPYGAVKELSYLMLLRMVVVIMLCK